MLAQIGGRYAFESVSLPLNARLTALGGIQNNLVDGDVVLALQNPAVSNVLMDHQLSINHNFHYAGISHGSVSFAHNLDSMGITTHAGIAFLNYGDFQASDEAGNINGAFSASEIAIVLGAGTQVNERIRAGANIKILSANYESYSAFGLGLDLGLHYSQPGSKASWSLALKNIGGELSSVNGNKRSLPLDLQLGFSNRLEHLPFRFTITAHQLQKWYIRYDDPDIDNTINLLGEIQAKSAFSKNLDNFFRHFVFSGEFLIGAREQFRLRMAYNHLRKQEMRLQNFRSLAGFSMGVGFNIKKIKFDYGIGYYHLNGATNHLSLRIDMGRFFKKI